MDIVIHSALVTVSFLGVVSEDLIPMPSRMTSQHVYEVRPRKDHRGADLGNMTVIEIRPHSNGWKVFEAPGVEPVFLGKPLRREFGQAGPA